MTGTTRSSNGLDHRRRRLLFRSWHRGIKEADLIMGPFADVMIERLSDTDLDDYEQLMQVPDSDLYRWVVSGETPPRPYNTPVFRRLREFHQPGGEPV